jgi:prepilin-type N-terminal cleavage/methylation domain-containing protein
MIPNQTPSRPTLPPAFSIIELVIVVAILGIIGMIAIPRLSRGSAGALESALISNVTVVQNAIERFAVEHGGRWPAQMIDGAIDYDGEQFKLRLLTKTNYKGSMINQTIYGPYLRLFPENPMNHLDTVRIDGLRAGVGTHGWRFNTTTGMFLPDDSFESADYVQGSGNPFNDGNLPSGPE